jgi:hypothetical protein
MNRIARLWLVGALVAALMALGPGVAWAAGLTSSGGLLAGDVLGQSSASDDQDDDGDGDEDDDDGDDDDGGGGGGQDRAFCDPPGAPDPGQCSTGSVRFDFEATSGPLGESPTGSARFDHGGGVVFDIDVTCLVVMGTRAAIGGPVTGVDLPPGTWAAFTVLDNSPATPGPDLISAHSFFFTGLPPNTPNCGSVFEPVFLVEGDIVVQDNLPGAGGGGGDDDGDDDGDDGDD